MPPIRYARSGDVNVAYQITGEGNDIDLVFAPGTGRHGRRRPARDLRRAGDAVRGIAVHTVSRIAGLASPGEVLVSSTIRDLTAGSGLRFEDRGVHTLKGVPEQRQLLRALDV